MQHYTRNTVEAWAWCRKCSKSTRHRVDGVKLGACIPCLERLEAESEARKAKPKPAEQLPIVFLAGMLLLLFAGCKAASTPTPPVAPPVVAPLNPPIPSAAVPVALYYDYDFPNAFMLCVPQAPNGGDGINFWCWHPTGSVTVQ
jgi:hypothetical protein